MPGCGFGNRARAPAAKSHAAATSSRPSLFEPCLTKPGAALIVVLHSGRGQAGQQAVIDYREPPATARPSRHVSALSRPRLLQLHLVTRSLIGQKFTASRKAESLNLSHIMNRGVPHFARMALTSVATGGTRNPDAMTSCPWSTSF